VRPIAFRPDASIRVTDSDSMRVDVVILAVTPPRDVDAPLSCATSRYRRVSRDAIPLEWKICGAYVNSYLARRDVQQRGFDDAILLDSSGRIAEASAANVFFHAGDELVTPSLDGDIFPGLTRSTVISLAREAGLRVVERTMRAEEMSTFDGAFVCSTLMELRRIARIDEHHFQSHVSGVFTELVSRFRAVTHRASRHSDAR
jgi:branched-chain amino acid aminotransferase